MVKKLLTTLSVAAVLASFASASNLNITKNLSVGVEKGLMDKQEVTAVNVSKSFLNYATFNANISNKTYKDYSLSLNLYSISVKNNGKIGIKGIYGYEIFNGRTTETITQQKQDQQITTTTTTKDTKRHQLYIGAAGNYIVTNNLTLYNEIDVGTKAVALKLGMQHNFTNHISAGAEISRRWSYDNDYDNTNNILFNISYSF